MTNGWRSVDRRLARLEQIVARIEAGRNGRREARIYRLDDAAGLSRRVGCLRGERRRRDPQPGDRRDAHLRGHVGRLRRKAPPGRRHGGPAKQGPPLHVHRNFVERYDIREGRVAIALHGTIRILEPGDRLEIPRGEAHTFKVEGDAPVRMVVDFEPAGTYEGFLERCTASRRPARRTSRAARTCLHMAVIGRKHLDDFALARRAYPKVLFTLLAPIGRLFGYRAAA